MPSVNVIWSCSTSVSLEERQSDAGAAGTQRYPVRRPVALEKEKKKMFLFSESLWLKTHVMQKGCQPTEQKHCQVASELGLMHTKNQYFYIEFQMY